MPALIPRLIRFWYIPVITALAGFIWFQSVRLDAARARRDAAVQALDLMTQDRDRQAAAVKQLSDINQDRALQLTRLRVDADKAAIVAQQVEQNRQQELAKLKSDLSSLKEKARANPDQVRPLGPIVRDALRMQ